MAQLKVYRFRDGKVGKKKVDATAFGTRSPRTVQREAVLMYQANRRAGTHAAKDRSEVKCTGRRPWKQKGTGRARAGDRASPIWRGGGVAHGPHPRSYRYGMPRKALRAAARAALAGKFRDDQVRFVDSIDLDAPSTKAIAGMLDALGVTGTFLLVLPKHDETVFRSARNLPGARVLTASDVNAYEVLQHRTLILTPDSFELLRERLGLESKTVQAAAEAPADKATVDDPAPDDGEDA